MAKKKSSQTPMLSGFDDLFDPIQQPEVATAAPIGPNSKRDTERSLEQIALATRNAPTTPVAPSLFPGPGDLVILVDSHSLIYQVFHALPAMTSPQGIEVGAIHGFLRDVANLLQQWKPDFFACTFDESSVTFRTELYDQYKANRESMPDALREQLPIIHQCLEHLAIPKLSASGFEADDIMATLALQAEQRGAKVLLVTSDKDCRQLLSDRVQMLNLRKSELFGVPELQKVWGIRPDQVVDFQALVGDASDNVPGVPMIGPKAAQQLLEQYDTLDGIYENVDQIPGKKKENLQSNHDLAILSRDLVRLSRDCPISLPWSAMRPGTMNREKISHLFRELGFRKLLESFQAVLAESESQPLVPSLPTDGYQLIDTDPKLRELVRHLHEATLLSIDTETTSTRPRDADLVGMSVSWGMGQSAYVPVRGPEGSNLIPLERLREELIPILADESKSFIGQNIKFDAIVLRAHGMPIRRFGFDTMVADYLLDPGGRTHDLDDLAKRWLGHANIPIESLIGSGKEQITMDAVPVEQVARYAAEDADVPLRLLEPMTERLREEKLLGVIEQLEIPLIGVLSDMEFEGITVDERRLGELRVQFQSQIDLLRAEIMGMVDEDFNPDSPKQLASVLFEQLGLRVVKRTKTGPSTDAEVLEELAGEHPLPAKIVEYRQLTKLLNTYIDSLPKLISPRTGRVHTSFRQDVAATGRLSSVEPNLQNIPVRTPEGRSIRSAFIPRDPAWTLLTADYSQIELRVLAHYCGDASLSQAFFDGIDIHTSVAAQVHGVELSQVTTDMRRGAKAVSFGILYGQSPFGLAKGLGISRTEASEFIDAYFAKFPSVRGFIAESLMECRRNGFVTTMSGRKRFLRGIRDFQSLPDNKKKQLLEPERMAINTVIQGSAADMIKMAMIALAKPLGAHREVARMLLQIHDELIFEVHRDHVPQIAALVRQEMTSVMPLSVPIVVDIKHGDSWAECEIL